MAQQQQHKVIQMEIRLNLMKHYKEHKPPDTGKHIQYDLTKLRADPQKIDRWMTQRNELPEHINHKTTAEEDWEKIKTPIQQAIQTVYPKKHPSQDKQSPEWAEKAKQWSTPQEWDTMQELIKERENKQKRIQGLDHKIKHQLKQIKLTQIINAWQQATKYLQKNKQNIQYAINPETEPPEKKRTRPTKKLQQ